MNRVQERQMSIKEAYDDLMGHLKNLGKKPLLTEEKLIALKERKMNRVQQRDPTPRERVRDLAVKIEQRINRRYREEIKNNVKRIKY